MRYFTYVYQNPGTRQEYGHVTHRVYWFRYAEITQVEDVDGDYLRFHYNVPDMGYYPFIEVDINGNALPMPPNKRTSMLNPLKFPSDTGVPNAPEWRQLTETEADPVLLYHYFREKRYR